MAALQSTRINTILSHGSIQKSCHAQIQNSTALLGSHYMVYRSHSHLSDLVQRYILSLDRRRLSFSTRILEYWKDNDGDGSLIEEVDK
jgi:hypothetical protein